MHVQGIPTLRNVRFGRVTQGDHTPLDGATTSLIARPTKELLCVLRGWNALYLIREHKLQGVKGLMLPDKTELVSSFFWIDKPASRPWVSAKKIGCIRSILETLIIMNKYIVNTG